MWLLRTCTGGKKCFHELWSFFQTILIKYGFSWLSHCGFPVFLFHKKWSWHQIVYSKRKLQLIHQWKAQCDLYRGVLCWEVTLHSASMQRSVKLLLNQQFQIETGLVVISYACLLVPIHFWSLVHPRFVPTSPVWWYSITSTWSPGSKLGACWGPTGLGPWQWQSASLCHSEVSLSEMTNTLQRARQSR